MIRSAKLMLTVFTAAMSIAVAPLLSGCMAPAGDTDAPADEQEEEMLGESKDNIIVAPNLAVRYEFLGQIHPEWTDVFFEIKNVGVADASNVSISWSTIAHPTTTPDGLLTHAQQGDGHFDKIPAGSTVDYVVRCESPSGYRCRSADISAYVARDLNPLNNNACYVWPSP